MHTIRGFRYLWHTLRDKYKFEYLLPRRVNQDAVENLFGGVRSHGHRNVNPTAESFVHSLKALMLNNLASYKSSGENCEEDNAEVLFDAVKAFIESTPPENVREVPIQLYWFLCLILLRCEGLPFNCTFTYSTVFSLTSEFTEGKCEWTQCHYYIL